MSLLEILGKNSNLNNSNCIYCLFTIHWSKITRWFVRIHDCYCVMLGLLLSFVEYIIHIIQWGVVDITAPQETKGDRMYHMSDGYFRAFRLIRGCWPVSDILGILILTEGKEWGVQHNTIQYNETVCSVLSVHDSIFLKVRKLVYGERSNCKCSLFFVNHKKC